MAYIARVSKLSPYDALIRLMAAQGMTLQRIAAAADATQCGVRAYCIRHEIEIDRAERKARKHAQTPREAAMASMYRQGLCLATIGDKYGITRERVRQLIRKHGVMRAHGGQAIQAAQKAQQREASRAAVVQLRWGIDLETYKASKGRGGLLMAFKNQRNSSRLRGIPFDLTFGQWLSIWNASGKIELRGRGVGRYCMARIRDSGGYEPGNVHIQLCTENSADAVLKWVGKVKEIPGVFHLYPGRERAWYVKVGKKGLGYYTTQQEGADARAAYIAANGLRTDKSGRISLKKAA